MSLTSSFWWLFLLVLVHFGPTTGEPDRRKGRLFPVFQIVRFANDPCMGGSKNGTCYTEAECSSRGGVNEGSCAAGYGVCCVFNINCGETSSENCTFFESNAVTSGACSATICPCNSNICQLRLDFNNFMITGPVTASTTELVNKITGGVALPSGAATVSLQSQCLTDTFQVVGGGGVSNSDVLCGTLTGEHLYVESEPASCCNELVFQLGSTGFGGQAVANRQWEIKVTQYSCNYPNLAPQGCSQFFFGSNTGTVRTFNFNNQQGHHLANQDQTVCVRRERTMCRICWFADPASDFQVSGGSATLSGFNQGTVCCSYGPAGTSTKHFDCVNIPGAEKEPSASKMTGSNFCGRSNGLVTSLVKSISVTSMSTNLNSRTICSRRTPFYIRFRSDNFEFSMTEGTMGDVGAQLSFFMDSQNCN